MAGPISIAGILERNRVRVAPRVRPEFIEDIAGIEERNQFDDDRGLARRELRDVLKQETQMLLVEEEAGDDH